MERGKWVHRDHAQKAGHDLPVRSAIMPGTVVSALPPNSFMTKTNPVPNIDEYLRERLMPVEGAIPHIPGIEMFGNSIPVETVGGDLFEYINFQQRYDIEARIQQAQRLSKEFLEPLPPGVPLRNSVDDQVQWLKTMPSYRREMEAEYRFARSCEQVRRYGTTTPMLLENINLRMAQSVTARNALGIIEKEDAREIATMVYGEVRPGGHFRFANFGHPPPLVFSAEYRKFMNINESRMVQFLALGLQIPANHPDRKKYYSLNLRQTEVESSDLGEITLMSPGDILVLYTDGVYDGSDRQAREQLEMVLREHYRQPARDICNALLDYAVKQDELLRANGDLALIDDKSVFIVKRTS